MTPSDSTPLLIDMGTARNASTGRIDRAPHHRCHGRGGQLNRRTQGISAPPPEANFVETELNIRPAFFIRGFLW
jgi:hypothetical protein